MASREWLRAPQHRPRASGQTGSSPELGASRNGGVPTWGGSRGQGAPPSARAGASVILAACGPARPAPPPPALLPPPPGRLPSPSRFSDAAGRKERTSELQAWTWRMAAGWPFSQGRQLQVTGDPEGRARLPAHLRPPTRLLSSFPQSQGLRAQGSRTASPQQPQPLLGMKATVTGAREVVAPTSRGWSSWETVCTTSLTGWPSVCGTGDGGQGAGRKGRVHILSFAER